MISHPSRHCTVELQALPSRIGQVRRIVSAQLRYWHLDPLIDRAALGVTELLSNVHRHARPDKSCVVELELLVDRLTVSVRDHDPRLPVVADAAEDAALSTCGRGLAMVAAMSESWGARPEGEDGKVVWFTLPATTTARPQPARSPRRTPEQQPAPRRPETHAAPTPVTAAPIVTAPVVTSPVVTAPAPAVAHAATAPPTPARSAVPG
ncbi:ATP-binding protein [Streptomyces collinus]|uniref:ATP-binding protein n=1 Tax=Streptomyces collinus TaxID=42684 RepID=UPI00362EFD72